MQLSPQILSLNLEKYFEGQLDQIINEEWIIEDYVLFPSRSKAKPHF